MKTTRAIALLLLLSGSLATTAASAGPYHHHWGWGPHFGVGVGVGVGLGLAATWPYYYPSGYYPYGYYPYTYYPSAPVVVTQPAPTTYIQQNNPAPTQQRSTGDWYYCRDSAAYYPYVKTCPNGWERVPSQPQTQN